MWIKTPTRLYNLDTFERVVVVEAGNKWRIQGEREGSKGGTSTVTLAEYETKKEAVKKFDELENSIYNGNHLTVL